MNQAKKGRAGAAGGQAARGLGRMLLLGAAFLLMVASGGAAIHRLSAENQALRGQLSALAAQNEALEAQMPAVLLESAINAGSFAYQEKYPEMAVHPLPTLEDAPANTAYLTFDDGPSANTAAILDALAASGARATFFVVGKNIAGHEALLQRMVNEGHAIGIHTYSHDYKAIYASVDAYLEDFYEAWQAVYEACGARAVIFRFPGGSINGYNGGVYQQIIAEMTRRGFVYYDWNVSSQDATGKTYAPAQLTDFVAQGARETACPVVLLHDSAAKKSTAQAVPDMVRRLQAAGYSLEPLHNTVRPVSFPYHPME